MKMMVGFWAAVGENKRVKSDQRDEAAAFDNQFILLIDTSAKLALLHIQRYIDRIYILYQYV